MVTLFPFVGKLATKEYFTCDYKNGECWEYATHFVEGGFYCDEHTKVVVDLVKGE